MITGTRSLGGSALATAVCLSWIACSSPSNTPPAPSPTPTTVNLNATARGWYDLDGSSNGSLAGNGYFISVCNYADPRCKNGGVPASNVRNWFRFDLSVVSGTITAATLLLDSPALITGCRTFGCTPTTTATFTAFDVFPGSVTGLGAPSVAIWTDLGSGTPYGSVTVSTTDSAGVVTIPLNAAALTAINAKGAFVLGGSLTGGNDLQLLFTATANTVLRLTQ
jgi:hypothetical protein